jgi:glucokinase
MKKFLGIDIGGTKCAVCIGNADGAVLARREFPTVGSPAETLAEFEKYARELIAEHGAVLATGISCGGPLDSKTGVVLSPPNLPGWEAVPVVDFFRERFGVPAFLQNDANACALAEWKHGAGKGSDNMMFCTMGTGFGCGLILNGRLYEGTNGNAGELGHVRLTPDGPVGFGKAGSVEGYCGGNGIAQLAELRLGRRMLAKDLAQAAKAGDADAAAVYAEVGEKLGRALALAIDLLNPDCIVIGSIFARHERLIRPAMESVLRDEALPGALAVCRIVPAALGERIGDVAALTVALVGVRSQGTGDRGQGTEDRGQRSGDRDRKSEDRSRRTGVSEKTLGFRHWSNDREG